MLEDAAYIQQVLKQGSQRAFQALLEKYQNRVFTLCYKIIKNREEAEEVAQDVFVKCFKELNQLKEYSKFRQWLLRIAYTKAIDRVRKKRLIKSTIDETDKYFPIDKNTPLQSSIKNDHKRILHRAINRLNSDEASIITLYYLEELSVKEIGAITDLSSSNIKVKLFRARNQLKEILSKILKDDMNK